MALPLDLRQSAYTSQASIVRCIARTLGQGYRIDPRAVLATAGVERHWLNTADRRIPFELCSRLWQAAADATGDACFGLSAVQYIEVVELQGVDLLTLASCTLGEAVRRYCDFVPIMSNVACQQISQDEQGNWRLAFHVPTGTAVATPYARDFMLACYLRTFEQCTGLPAGKMLVDFTVAGAKTGSAAGWRKQGLIPRYNQSDTALVFSGHYWHRRTMASNPRLQAHLELPLLQQLRLLDKPTPLSALRSRLALLLNADPTAARLAEHLKLTTRQLEHDLFVHGLTFNQLLDEARHDTALKLLAQPEIPLDLIAHQLGLSKASSLIRALHRWEGVTPKIWRQRQAPSFTRRRN